MNNRQPNFSLDDFKRWMRKHDSEEENSTEQRQSNLVGLRVESKIEEDRIQAKMKEAEGYPEDLAFEFFENGGVIANVDGKYFLIEVDAGTFLIHRAYVRRS